MTRTAIALTLAAAAIAGASTPALAQSKGDFTLGFGIHNVSPQGGTSNTTAGPIKVDDNARPSLTFEYFVADNVGIEVLAAWPFEHDIQLVGTGNVGKTKHLPPTISIQYHFANQSAMTPFIGAGLNYTHFFDDRGTGVLAGTDIDLDDSWGLALHAGLDFAISDRSALRADIRWIDIDTKAKIGGAPIGTVKIDPVIFGVAYVHRF